MLSLLITTLILKLTNKIGRGDKALVRCYTKFAHCTGAFFAALEGHLILQYVYPHLYVAIFFLEGLTGLDLSKFFY